MNLVARVGNDRFAMARLLADDFALPVAPGDPDVNRAMTFGETANAAVDELRRGGRVDSGSMPSIPYLTEGDTSTGPPETITYEVIVNVPFDDGTRASKTTVVSNQPLDPGDVEQMATDQVAQGDGSESVSVMIDRAIAAPDQWETEIVGVFRTR